MGINSRKISLRKYYLSHKDAINERRRSKYKRDLNYRVAIKVSARKYIVLHRDKINEHIRARYKTDEAVRVLKLADSKRYRKENPLKFNKYLSEYYKKNPEKRRIKNRKHRAMMRCVGHEPYCRDYIFERDKWECQICGRKINKRLKYPNPLSASLDHIVPLSKGGDDRPINVQASHLRCNLGKNATNIGQLRLFG